MINDIIFILIFKILETMGVMIPTWLYVLVWAMFALNATATIIKACQKYIEIVEERRKRELLEKLDELKETLNKASKRSELDKLKEDLDKIHGK